MIVSLREPIIVPKGLWGNAALMALAARPPRRGDNNRHNLALAAIRHYAASAYYDKFGAEHPDAPRVGKRSRADRRASLNGVFMDLKKSVDAGRMFLSSLAAHDPATAKKGHAVVTLRHSEKLQLSIPALPHNEQLSGILMEASAVRPSKGAEPSTIRQARWDNWLQTIHLGAAFALLYDGNAQYQGELDWNKFCLSLIFESENEQMAAVLVSNANRLLRAAAECYFFPKARPRPFVIEG